MEAAEACCQETGSSAPAAGGNASAAGACCQEAGSCAPAAGWNTSIAVPLSMDLAVLRNDARLDAELFRSSVGMKERSSCQVTCRVLPGTQLRLMTSWELSCCAAVMEPGSKPPVSAMLTV